MPKFKSKSAKNFCYGKQLMFAGANALKTHMPGQFQTIANHRARWSLFCEWAKTQQIREAHQVTRRVLEDYANYLRARLEGQGKALAVSTAQNRLSTCNVVLKYLRGNEQVKINPAKALHAQRHTVRTKPPETSREVLGSVQNALRKENRHHEAVLLGLCRELGLRIREASLLNCKEALKQASHGVVNITRGTKGGRSKSTKTSPSKIDRIIPVTKEIVQVLAEAEKLQEEKDNLISKGKKLSDFMVLVRMRTGPILKRYGIKNRHELRASYACDRYQQITGYDAPVIAGTRVAPDDIDREAREIISQELGHSRPDVLVAYVGSRKAVTHERQVN